MSSTFEPNYNTCHAVSALCPVSATTYGYIPNEPGNIFLTVWFGLLTVAGLIIGIKSRAWTYTFALTSGAFLECAGYIGRDLMSQNVWNNSAFQLQIITLIIAPSFVAASIYLTFKHLVIHLGQEHSWLQARYYPWIFVGCDIGSIALQAVGGGVAASASKSNNASTLTAGNDIIIAGIAFQVATMIVAGALAAVYFTRLRKAQNDRTKGASARERKAPEYEMRNVIIQGKLRLFCIGVAIAYVTILIRCIYRLPEMSGGWGGPLQRVETDFLILDGGMVAIAATVLTVIHPAFYFPQMCFPKKREQDPEVNVPSYPELTP